ncbi:DUF5794 domain-containing protein [Halohasta salina]|uniref:DUF5794 domain-containing protein n=1 Tax=Halohasta salina TaxID=2961621 RepID=UPI0020A5CFA7|nr:DUF5794 domain-containing protein [Halohasta salina]
MSVSQHPVALQLERRVGGATRLLATVMALPLVDGIFVALLLAGTLDSPLGMLETGLLIFGGSATVAVILAEMDDSPRALVGPILLIGAVVVPVAAIEAVFAVTIESVLDMAVFERFAGLVILTVAAQTASSKLGELLPSPGVIIGLGLIASLRPDGLVIDPLVDPALIGRAAATAGIGVAFALVVALVAPQLRGRVDIDRFRFGSSVALGVLALPILGVLETDAPIALAVLVVAALFAYDPEAATDRPEEVDADRSAGVADAAAPRDESVLTGEDPAATMAVDPEPSTASGDVGYGAPGEDSSRAPWL